jgi:methanogenic corrinoid protein MtbC1
VSTERPIAFDPAVLDEAERRAQATGHDLSAFVNDSLRRQMRLLAPPMAGAAPIEVHRDAYLKALLERDAARARDVVRQALESGVAIPDLYAEVLGPALTRVGHMWALNEINVAQEHYATSVTQTLMGTLAVEAPAPAGGRLAVVTSTPDELHLLGGQMVADILRREGWEVMDLGAATPAGDLAELVEMECPDLVALSASTAGRLPGVADVLGQLADVEPRPLVVVGGSLFSGQTSDYALEMGADLVLSDVRELIDALRERFPPMEG